MDDQKPNQIPELKANIVDAAIQLLRIDPSRGSFAIDHAFRVGFDQPSSRVILSDMRGYVDTLAESIRELRALDANAGIVVEDGIRIAMGAAFTPRKTA